MAAGIGNKYLVDGALEIRPAQVSGGVGDVGHGCAQWRREA